jgi:hypothetical protein
VENVTLSSKQVAYIAGEKNPFRLSTIAGALELEHMLTGSGHPAHWDVRDALTLAFAFALMPRPHGGHQISYMRYESVCRDAATRHVHGVTPGWIVVAPGVQRVWSVFEDAELAEWLLEHTAAARILRCAPVLERLEKALADAG